MVPRKCDKIIVTNQISITLFHTCRSIKIIPKLSVLKKVFYWFYIVNISEISPC